MLQIAALRKNVDAEGNALVDNYRPPQGLNERTVYHYDVNMDLSAELEAPCTDLQLGEACDTSAGSIH